MNSTSLLVMLASVMPVEAIIEELKNSISKWEACDDKESDEGEVLLRKIQFDASVLLAKEIAKDRESMEETLKKLEDNEMDDLLDNSSL